MKRKIIVGSTLVALALTLTLFAVSVFAAVSQVFGVNNIITFVGSGEYLVFDLEARITGTTKTGEQEPTFSWNYDYSKTDSHQNAWNINEPLIFNQEGVTPGEEYIIYSFSVTNYSVGDKKIQMYIEEPDIDLSVLKYEITGRVASPIVIDRNQTGTAMLKLMPTNGYFNGARDCNFKIIIEQIG